MIDRDTDYFKSSADTDIRMSPSLLLAPEYLFGAIMSLAACFAAYALIKRPLRKNRAT